MSTTKAAETIFTITSPDVGRLLCDELGWNRKKHAAWVADTLKRVLLADERAVTPVQRDRNGTQ
jgi:hypothetical protein